MSLFFDHRQPPVTTGQVIIRSPSNPRELLYIEIQGEIKSTLPLPAATNNVTNNDKRYLWDQELGTYTEEDDGKTSSLTVGNLKLIGTKEKLKKPFLLLSKQKQPLPIPRHQPLLAKDNTLDTNQITSSTTTVGQTLHLHETLSMDISMDSQTHITSPDNFDPDQAVEQGMAVIGIVTYIVRFSKRPIPLIKLPQLPQQ